MGALKREILGKKIPYENLESTGASHERASKNLPANRLTNRLGLRRYDVPAPMEDTPLSIDRIKIPLKQHIGAPCEPSVTVGQAVQAGDPVGRVPEGQLGAPVHTGITGTVTAVTDEYVEIQGKGGSA